MICPSCQAENDDAAAVCFDCRAVLRAVTRGTLLAGRYEVTSALGRGGMGSVYRAHDRTLDEDVAVKVLRNDLADTPEAERRFRSEIKLARTVSHWNVCRIHEYGEQDGLRYISMELVEGETLKELVRRRGALPPVEALEVAIQVADGLEAIHRVGIVHRDLTSLNVTRDQAGRVRVMDFGIAKRVAGEETKAGAASGYVVGNPEYMSPEQARGRAVDFRSDLYSFGIVLFEMLTARLPFRGDSPVATLLQHIEAPPPLDVAEATALPTSLINVLRRALAKDPGERYESARELGDALRSARDTLATGTRPLGPRLRAPALLLAMVAALVVLAVIATRARPPAAPQPTTLSLAPIASAVPLAIAPPETTMPAPASTPPASRAIEERPAPPPSESPTATLAPSTIASLSPPSTAPPATDVPASATSVAPGEEGFLTVAVQPWADVSVDGSPVGQTPLGRLRLSPGAHDVLLSHPDYLPYRRRVTIRTGETMRLVVQLPSDGVRRR